MFRRTSIKRFLVAVAATGLLAAGCGGGDPESQLDAAPTSGAEDAGTTTTTTEGAMQPSEATTEDVPESELVEPAEQAPVVQSADHEEEAVEGFPEVEPLERDVICGDGLVLLAEFVTDTDNGCRPEMCDDGRTDHGDCQLPPEDEPMTEEEVAELPTETIPQEEYGLEGCTEVSLGVCDQDGLLFCHDTVEGWNECPGQPSEGCTKNDAAAFAYDHLDQPTGNELLSPSLSPGVWKLTARVCGNDTMTGNPSGFVVSVRGSATIAHIYQESVVDWFGEQSFTITEDTGAIEVWVTPEGNGQWVVAFYPIA